MNVPSPPCLRALRLMAFPSPSSVRCPQRCLATASDKRPPPPTSTRPPSAPPTFRPSPSGSDLRKRRDDDEDFTPYPLWRPIGMPDPPLPGDNMGLDHRTLRQRRDDFHDYDKHLQRRATMTRQIAKPYFRDWSNMRFHKGKVFVANDRLFRADLALFFPNFFGRTLRADALRRGGKDGYRGLGRDTCEVMRGKVSVVSVVSNVWAERQVDSFCSREANPELHRLLAENRDVAQRVEINKENNFLKWWLMQLFAVPKLRKQRSVEEQERYFMVRRGVSEDMKEAIGLLNDKGGYVYLVDDECKIRWGGSAEANEAEKVSMVRGLRRMIQEARVPLEERKKLRRGGEELDNAVIEEADGQASEAIAAKQ